MSYPYNNYYQPYYQPMPDQLAQLRSYQQQNNLQPTQMSASNDERIWVSNRNAAEAYLVAPNGFVRLWDSSRNLYYEKRADASGRPYMETFEYKRISDNQPNQDIVPEDSKNDYAEQIKALESRISALENRRVKTNAKSDADDK